MPEWLVMAVWVPERVDGVRVWLCDDGRMATHSTQSVDRGADGAMQLDLWTPDSEPRMAMLVIQEIFGVGPYIRAVCQRLADAGYLVAAPDVFWRFAPHWEAAHDEAGLSESFAKVQQLDFPVAVSDCVAALEHLGEYSGLATAPGVIGFCLGGTLAWAVAASGSPSVCISYYGSGVPAMIGSIDDVHCPTLLHFGNADDFIPNDGVDVVAAAIAGRPGFVLNVENAGHAFDNHESEMFYNQPASNAAWAKTMAFLVAHSPS
ncbi:MAG: dienelactone hydrolase family protein [Ilumatobacteraceae bacterium]